MRHLIYFESRKRIDVDGFSSSVCIHKLSSIEVLGAKPESRGGICELNILFVVVMRI